MRSWLSKVSSISPVGRQGKRNVRPPPPPSSNKVPIHVVVGWTVGCPLSPNPTLAVRTDDDATVCACNSKQHGSKEHVPFWNLRSIAAANVRILTGGPRQSSATRDPSSYLVLYYNDEWLQLVRVAASYREQRTTPCLAEERPILPPYLPLASS